MRKVLCTVPLILVLLLVSCGKKESGPVGSVGEKVAQAVSSSSPAEKGGDPLKDYKVPYLNDEKMVHFLDSLKESKNPFEILFKANSMSGLSQIRNEVEKFNDYAKKYGFQGYEDYMAVWGRITVAEIVVAAEKMKEGTIKMLEGLKKSAEEGLKRPNLSSEERKDLEQQIAENTKSIEEMKNPGEQSISKEDMAVYLKYKDQIEEAVKKYKK